MLLVPLLTTSCVASLVPSGVDGLLGRLVVVVVAVRHVIVRRQGQGDVNGFLVFAPVRDSSGLVEGDATDPLGEVGVPMVPLRDAVLCAYGARTVGRGGDVLAIALGDRVGAHLIRVQLGVLVCHGCPAELVHVTDAVRAGHGVQRRVVVAALRTRL